MTKKRNNDTTVPHFSLVVTGRRPQFRWVLGQDSPCSLDDPAFARVEVRSAKSAVFLNYTLGGRIN